MLELIVIILLVLTGIFLTGIPDEKKQSFFVRVTPELYASNNVNNERSYQYPTPRRVTWIMVFINSLVVALNKIKLRKFLEKTVVEVSHQCNKPIFEFQDLKDRDKILFRSLNIDVVTTTRLLV